MTRPLTDRQWQIAHLLGSEGLPRKAIAQRLNISRFTVREHIYGSHTSPGLYQATDARSDLEVAVWWWKCGRHQRPFGLAVTEDE